MVFCINIIFLKLVFLGLDNENWSGTPSKKVNCPNFRPKKNETEVLDESNSNKIRIKRKAFLNWSKLQFQIQMCTKIAVEYGTFDYFVNLKSIIEFF